MHLAQDTLIFLNSGFWYFYPRKWTQDNALTFEFQLYQVHIFKNQDGSVEEVLIQMHAGLWAVCYDLDGKH